MTEKTNAPRYDRVQDQLLALSERKTDPGDAPRYRDTPWNRAFGLSAHKRREATEG